MSRGTAIGAVAFLAVGVAAGALLFGGESPSDGSGGQDATIEKVSFQADAPAGPEEILALGGLTIRASCLEQVPGQPAYLSVSAETAVDDSVIAVSFGQKKGSESQAYTFGLSDFDRAYGEWDFLGQNPDNTTGTLGYSTPDGGELALTFVADQQTAQGECLFSGSVVFHPGNDREAPAVSAGEDSGLPDRSATVGCEGITPRPGWRLQATSVESFGLFVKHLSLHATEIANGNHLVKAGAVVVGGRPVTLRVPGALRGTVGLVYGDESRGRGRRPAAASTQVTFNPCTGSRDPDTLAASSSAGRRARSRSRSCRKGRSGAWSSPTDRETARIEGRLASRAAASENRAREARTEANHPRGLGTAKGTERTA